MADGPGDKARARRALLAERDGIPAEVRAAKGRLITAAIAGLPELVRARRVLAFASFRSEFDTTALMRECLAAGRTILLPVVERASNSLALYLVEGLHELTPGYMGIPEPLHLPESRRRRITDADVAIVPGAGYDPDGHRIGYGGGYYDRLLSGRRDGCTLIAPAFEEQLRPGVPFEPHDIRVDIIVTDRRTITVAS
jgi:5-formyltetrahydrofolate cyclo-ligase